MIGIGITVSVNQGKQEPKVGRIRERNTKQILDAAQEEFVLHGFKGTSMQSIADRAELPKANIHYYFKNKENLYNEVLNQIIQSWDAALPALSESNDPKTVLTDFIRKKMYLSFENPNGSKIFAMEIIQGGERLQNYMSHDLREWVKQRVQIMERWIEQGKMRPVDPTHLIFMIWATTQHYADFNTQVLEITNQREFEDDEKERITQSVIDIILNGLGLN